MAREMKRIRQLMSEEDNIKVLDDVSHIRLRRGMYIGDGEMCAICGQKKFCGAHDANIPSDANVTFVCGKCWHARGYNS